LIIHTPLNTNNSAKYIVSTFLLKNMGSSLTFGKTGGGITLISLIKSR